ncbi:TPA: hypothetical protein ACGOY9_002038 [Streptococcus suis]|uniref:Uncharacterized protein n=1 Tax=Streptococcus suis TaxID=1307 RepID=A0A0Z8E9K9_STRSU|nr:hypothetical protein [Streptococcus suis]CYU57760.1 Uncharacterised protein [Streptococcus suis]CYX34465.1 Uncharacterised protein [Streptococcus suis]
MIEVFPVSIFSLFIALLTKIFFLGKRIGYKVKITLHYHHFKSRIPTTYFIIKTKRLTDEKMHYYLQDIRRQSELANIIIIGGDINYEALFKNHYRVFGVIDTSEDKSLKSIKKQLDAYLHTLYIHRRY